MRSRTRYLRCALAFAVLGVLGTGCSGGGYDGAVGAQRADAESKLAAVVASQRAATSDQPWASHVGDISLDDTGTKVYILTDLAPGAASDEATGVAICTAYSPAVADFPDIGQLIVADADSVEVARCAVERETETG